MDIFETLVTLLNDLAEKYNFEQEDIDKINQIINDAMNIDEDTLYGEEYDEGASAEELPED